jgi:hypothetical protein
MESTLEFTSMMGQKYRHLGMETTKDLYWKMLQSELLSAEG